MDEKVKICCFCGNQNLKLLYRALYHPFKMDHGPFEFYTCKNCDSGLTMPLPTSDQLASLYASFSDGLIPSIRKIRNDNPLTAWYKQCVCRALQKASIQNITTFNWLDIGAGNGEVSSLLSAQLPNSMGLAVDYHDKPQLLQGVKNISWEKADINLDRSLKNIGTDKKYDLVFLVTVLEHVMYPEILVSHLLSKLKKGGCLYLTVPDFGSLAATLLKKRWPYFLPGEHLNIPSIKGMRLLLENICEKAYPGIPVTIEANTTTLPYPLGYYLDYFGIHKFPHIFSRMPLKIPTGIMEASVVVK